MSFLKSVKKAVKQVGGAALTAAGAYYGGPAGASAASSLGSSFGLDTSGLLGNLVQGAVGVGTDYLQSQNNLKQQKELAAYTAQQQNALNEQAYYRNLYQWNMENAYNSPAAQMQRYADAGLNKNLIYGQSNTAANSPTLQPATYDPGSYRPVDKSAQRQQLAIAMMEHKQMIENQAIQNDLARQRLVLQEREANREDALTTAKINNLTARRINLTSPSNSDKSFDDDKIQKRLDDGYNMRVKQWKLAEQAHKNNLGFKASIASRLGLKRDPWYDQHPYPRREVLNRTTRMVSYE